MDIEQHLLYRGLSCSGAAGDDTDRVAERFPDTLLLFRGKDDAQFFLCFRQQEGNILFLLFCRKQGYQILCRAALIPVHIRGIKGAVFVVHPPFLYHLVEYLVDCHFRDGLPPVALIQLSIYFSLELLLILKQMPFLFILFHAVPDAALDPQGIVRLSLVGFCDLIHGQETKPADLTERKGQVLYGIQRRIPKFLIDLPDLFWRYLKGRQIRRKVTHGVAALVGKEDAVQLFTGNAFNFQQAVRIMVQHIKCPCAESLHDQFRQFRSDTLNHAGGQVTPDPLLCLGHDFLITFHL